MRAACCSLPGCAEQHFNVVHSTGCKQAGLAADPHSVELCRRCPTALSQLHVKNSIHFGTQRHLCKTGDRF